RDAVVADRDGRGTVTVVSPEASAITTVAPGEPLALSPVALSQFSHGFRFVPATGSLVSAPPEASAFDPEPLAPVAAPLWLDGSASAWTASAGSVDRFLASLPPEASVAVVSPSGAADGATTFDYVLGERAGSTWINLDAPEAAAEIAAADVLVLVGLARETAGPRLAPGTASGDALHATARPTLWLGSATALAGPQAVTGTESRADASFRGLLGMASGGGLLGGALVMPLAWGDDTAFWENHAAGLFWGLTQSGAGLGLLVPDGTALEMSGTAAVARGDTPVLVVDARAATLAATPEVRHNGSLVGATVRVLPMDTAVDLAPPSTAAESDAPLAPEAPRLAPNPSSGTATLRVTIDRPGEVTATAFDALGRRVASHTWGGLSAGAYRLDWTWPLALPAGVYTLRITRPGAVDAVSVTLAR
ncbi:MAG: hypothetical protein AAFQ43_12615, partial [Bacteroidota bacterium]